jgi:hypothetical protein
MNKHTPGPWQWDGDYTLRPVNPDPSRSALHTILSPDGPYGFVQTSTADVWPEFEANKRLIAAAPDLLVELQDAVAMIEALGGNASTQRTAIAKATGGER